MRERSRLIFTRAKKGWWRITRGQTMKVHSGLGGGHKYLYYAEADDLSPTWLVLSSRSSYGTLSIGVETPGAPMSEA
jgi:hypothetical protein